MIYDCHVSAYRRGRICLVGDAGASARPRTAAGALKSINDAVALSTAIQARDSIAAALTAGNAERTEINNKLVTYGNQLGRALVKEIPDWSTMDATRMQRWFSSIVETPTAVIVQNRASRRKTERPFRFERSANRARKSHSSPRQRIFTA